MVFGSAASEKTPEEILKGVALMLDEIINDTTVPRNIRAAAEKAKEAVLKEGRSQSLEVQQQSTSQMRLATTQTCHFTQEPKFGVLLVNQKELNKFKIPTISLQEGLKV